MYKVFLDPKQFRDDMDTLQKSIDKRTSEKAAGTYTPKYDKEGNELDVLPESLDAFRSDTVTFLALKLGISEEKVKTAMEENTQYSVLQDQVEKPVADEVLDYFNNV